MDALPPEVLQELVRNTIELKMDREAYEAIIEREGELKKKLVQIAEDIG